MLTTHYSGSHCVRVKLTSFLCASYTNGTIAYELTIFGRPNIAVHTRQVSRARIEIKNGRSAAATRMNNEFVRVDGVARIGCDAGLWGRMES